jgi:pantothenate kinase
MELSLDRAVGRAGQLAAAGRRVVLGITGPPGAGKSTLAERVVAELGPQRAALVPMDGFHIADALLVSAGMRGRKGAPETFDRQGFAAALQRLRRADHTVYLPRFDRDIEDSTAAAIAVPADIPLVVVEGNYLLLWEDVRSQLDESWYLDVAVAERQQRLVGRRLGLGFDEAEARRWALGSDERNALVIAGTRKLADVVLI